MKGLWSYDFWLRHKYIKPCISNILVLYHIRLSKIARLAWYLRDMAYLAYLKLIIPSVYHSFFHQQRMIRGRHPQPYDDTWIHWAATFRRRCRKNCRGAKRRIVNLERWTIGLDSSEKWWPSMRSIGLSCLTVVPQNWIMDYYWNSGELDDSTMKPSSWGNRINRNWGFIYPETNQHHSSITLVLLLQPSKAHGGELCNRGIHSR